MRRTTTETLLNWVEIRGVRWQENDDATKTLDDFLKGLCLVNRAVVKDQYTLVLRVRIH